MKWISITLVTALLVQVVYLPCSAQEAVVMKGEEIDRTRLKVGAYVYVTYHPNKKAKEISMGYIKAVDDDALIVNKSKKRKRGKTIQYKDIITLVMGSTEQDILHFTVVPGAKVRITAPSIAEHRFVGTLTKTGVDSLVLTRKDFRTLVVSMASVTKLEVNPGGKSQAGIGAAVGLLIGAIPTLFLVDFTKPKPPSREFRLFESGVSGSGIGVLVLASGRFRKYA